MTTTNQSVDRLCHSVMVGVAKTYSGSDLSDRAEEACQIMREEVKAFLFDDSYAAERECVLLRSISESYVVASIITRCVSRLVALKGAS